MLQAQPPHTAMEVNQIKIALQEAHEPLIANYDCYLSLVSRLQRVLQHIRRVGGEFGIPAISVPDAHEKALESLLAHMRCDGGGARIVRDVMKAVVVSELPILIEPALRRFFTAEQIASRGLLPDTHNPTVASVEQFLAMRPWRTASFLQRCPEAMLLRIDRLLAPIVEYYKLVMILESLHPAFCLEFQAYTILYFLGQDYRLRLADLLRIRKTISAELFMDRLRDRLAVIDGIRRNAEKRHAATLQPFLTWLDRTLDKFKNPNLQYRDLWDGDRPLRLAEYLPKIDDAISELVKTLLLKRNINLDQLLPPKTISQSLSQSSAQSTLPLFPPATVTSSSIASASAPLSPLSGRATPVVAPSTPVSEPVPPTGCCSCFDHC